MHELLVHPWKREGMTTDQKLIATLIFKNKVLDSDAQAYEDLFSSVMSQKNPDFRQVKPQGSYGDRKNDGFDPNTGSYYQVYAPEDITTADDKGIKKLETDFKKLYSYWPQNGFPVKTFRFVVNDKYKGVGPGYYDKLKALKVIAPGVDIDIMSSIQLEKIFQSLDEMGMINVIGAIPSPDISMLEIDALHSVVKHIMNSKPDALAYTIPVNPNFNQKIEYNGLSDNLKSRLIAALISDNVIQDYFSANNNFVMDELRNRFNTYYLTSKNESPTASPDEVFWKIYSKALPHDASKAIADALLSLMAYYFQCCDIFESPEL